MPASFSVPLRSSPKMEETLNSSLVKKCLAFQGSPPSGRTFRILLVAASDSAGIRIIKLDVGRTSICNSLQIKIISNNFRQDFFPKLTAKQTWKLE